MYPKTTDFANATLILPVMDETYSLVQTVESIVQSSRPYLRELLIVICEKTTIRSLACIDTIYESLGDLVVVHHQSLPHLGGAMREAFALARGSHIITMASDLETDPNLVPILIQKAREAPDSITTVTRWHKDGGFAGYGPIKLLANAVFQKLFSFIYQTNLTDMTYAYRIFPTKLVQAIQWTELRHPFLLETIIKPLRLGVQVNEVPGHWRARTEGKSHNSFLRNFEYLRIGLRVRFSAASSLILPPK